MDIIKKIISHSLLERRIHLKRIKKIILVVVVKKFSSRISKRNENLIQSRRKKSSVKSALAFFVSFEKWTIRFWNNGLSDLKLTIHWETGGTFGAFCRSVRRIFLKRSLFFYIGIFSAGRRTIKIWHAFLALRWYHLHQTGFAQKHDLSRSKENSFD